MWVLIAHQDDEVAGEAARVLAAAGHATRRERYWHDVVEDVLAGLCEVVLLGPGLPGLTPQVLAKLMLCRGTRRPRVLLYDDASPVILAVQAAALQVDGCLSREAGAQRLLDLLEGAWSFPPPPSHPGGEASVPARRSS